MSPFLPPELECTAFILALDADYENWKSLVLVAKRVYEWLMPHVFNVVLLHKKRGVPIGFNKSILERYGQHTRHLFIAPDHLGEYLYLFPNATNLTLWAGNHDHLRLLQPLPLARLSVCPDTDYPPTLELFQLFARLTHLELGTLCSTWTDDLEALKKVVYLPNLTHFCVIRGFWAPMLRVFLERSSCPVLEVVIVWGHGEGEPHLRDGGDHEIEDSRLVLVSCEPLRDWEVGARGGVDMWRFADGIIASRKGL